MKFLGLHWSYKKSEEELHREKIEETTRAIVEALQNRGFSPIEQVNILNGVFSRFKKELTDARDKCYAEGRTYKRALKEL